MEFKEKEDRGNNGFTIAEILIAMTVLSLVVGMSMFFFTSTLKMMFTAEQKLKINRDIRNLTNEMTGHGRDATIGLVYESFYSLPGGDFRNPAGGKKAQEYQLRDDETGDLLVLAYYGLDPDPADTVRAPIVRLIGYYRSVENESENMGPVMTFDIDIPEVDQTKKIEQLIPSEPDSNNHDEVIEVAKGLADEHLFYNFRGRSVMINAQIFHGNDAKRVTDTYNFTITPRGPRGNDDAQ